MTNPYQNFRTTSFTFFVFLFALLLSQPDLFAQKNKRSKIKFGFKGGINLSKFTNDIGPFDKEASVNNNSSLKGYNKSARFTGCIGATIDYPISEELSFGAEFLYNGRGSAYKAKTSITSTQNNASQYNYFKFKMEYIEFPLKAEYLINKNINSSPIFIMYGGFAPAFIAARTLTYDYFINQPGTPLYQSTNKNSNLDYVRNFNVSYLCGLQIMKEKTDKKNFYIDLRYSKTMLPVFANEEYSDGSNMKTQMWTTSLAIGIIL